MRASRRGASLIELVVVIVLLAAIGSATMEIVIHQERFYRAQARRHRFACHGARRGIGAPERAARAHATRRRSLRDRSGHGRVSRDAGAERDLHHLRRRAARSPSRPSISPSGAPLTWIGTQPEAGDTLLVLASDSTLGDRWDRHVLTGAPSRAGSVPHRRQRLHDNRGRDASAALTLSLSPALDGAIAPGALVRIVRRARYELYRASDSRWYLGYLDCLASRATPCNVVQPVSGPFAPAGIQLAYLDASGAPTANPRLVARIDLLAIAERRSSPATLDSLATTIALRN